MNIFKEIKNRTILVTGGTGSIGSALVKELLRYNPKQVRVLSRDESKQYHLLENLDNPSNLRLLIGDIRDTERLDLAFRGVDMVFHAAALKHVPFCEYNPFEAVKTNIIGANNVINAAIKAKVKKVIAISTDKVVNPLNVMGTSKLMMEKLMISAHYYSGTDGPSFSCVRFGNVAWSRGSVFSLWKRQIKKSKSLKITDPEMTRFLMSKKQAIELLLKSAVLAKGGEIFIFKMPSIKLGQLKDLFLKKYFPKLKIRIQKIKKRDGEKIHEELINVGNNSDTIYENKEMFILIPELQIYTLILKTKEYPGFKKIKLKKNYSSKDYLDFAGVEKII